MVWLLKSKAVRKPVVLVGAACTSVVLGVMVFDRILSSAHNQQSHFLSRPPFSSNHPHASSHHATRHCSSCTNSSTNPSYTKLKKYEATRFFKNSVIKRMDVVYLGSNSPIEDRFVVGTSENLGGAFFSMIDGHRGTHCSQYLQENMLQHVSAHLHKQVGLQGQDDLQILLDMDLVEREVQARNSEQSPKATLVRGGEGVAGVGDNAESAAELIEASLRESLTTLDNKISQRALKDVQLIHSGHSLTPEMKDRIMTAIDGACSLTAMVRHHDIIVANTGDCRVVLGQKVGGGGSFKPLPLSEDQNVANLEEVKRVRTSHPSEPKAISGGRILGGLMPFRTFGDADYKWERKHLQGIVPIMANYKTPPYVTAEPVMSRHVLSKDDKFVVIATDGFWERVSNQDAIDTVAKSVSHSRGKKRSIKELLGMKSDTGGGGGRGVVANGGEDSAPNSPCCKVNVATELLWQALGGEEQTVAELLQLEPGISRWHRDDITIMVLHL